MNYELGKKIRLLRLSNNMTQEQLAEKLNVTPQSVSKWENNITAPDIQLLPEISVIFGVTIDDLFSITEESKLERIENLFLNSSDITVISDKDFESYRTFLVENIDNPKIKNRVIPALAYLYIFKAKNYKNIAVEYAIKSVETEPEKKDNHSILNYALDGRKRDWYTSNNCKVIDFYKYFIKNNPDNVYAYYILLDNLIADNRIDDAEKYLNQLETIDNSCRSIYYRAQICCAKGDFAAFNNCIYNMQKNYENDWLCWSLCGDLYSFAAQYDNAIECFEKAFELQPSPKYTDSLLSLARICEIKGDFAKAAEYYSKTIKTLEIDWNTTDGDLIDSYKYLIDNYQNR